ncbi:ANTAR domain-containing protein [Streptomyces sp. NPDC087440]|uniref:ANTAR domain-containing protein n=1 Tax=Streptomyces sp. NPDC087440 TaxID=3365790 RepID=UPI003816B6DD
MAAREPAQQHGELTVLLGALRAGGKGPDTDWAVRCARLLDMDGLCVSSQADSGELLWFSGELSARLDDLQFTVGEGPSFEAGKHGTLSLATDLRTIPTRHWAAFVPGAEELGVRSVFAFPLRLGAISVGAMTGYRREPRALTEAGIDAALTLCDALTLYLLSSVAPPGRGEPHATVRPGSYESDRGAYENDRDTYESDRGPHENDPGNRPSGLHRAVVHQASGMLSVELGVNLATALDRLRAYAFAHHRPIVAVSRDVVARRVQLTADCPGPGHAGCGNG